jgi:hypothetical protein
MSWLYDGLAERWEFWLPTAALAEVTYPLMYIYKIEKKYKRSMREHNQRRREGEEKKKKP